VSLIDGYCQCGMTVCCVVLGSTSCIQAVIDGVNTATRWTGKEVW